MAEALFVELKAFTRELTRQRLPDEWLRELQINILDRRGRMAKPKKLGGFEKIRMPNPGRGKGTSGGFRVYFIRYTDLQVVVLALISDKDVEDNISDEEKKQLRSLAVDVRKEIARYVQPEKRTRRRTRRRP